MAGNCEECVHYDYDDEVDAWFCTMDLDEDEKAALQAQISPYLDR